MLAETLLVGTTRTAADGLEPEGPAIAQYNLHTGAALVSVRRSQTAVHGLAYTPAHVLAQQSDRSIINVYSARGLTLETTVPFPEAFTALAASPCGHYVAGGTQSGRVYLWQLAGGRVAASAAAHVQRVTALAFSGAATHVVAGSADATVSVWSAAQLLDTRAAGTRRGPERVLNRHAGEVTAVAVGRAAAGGPSELLVSAARDGRVVASELHSGRLLRTFVLAGGGVPLCLALDPAERAVYVGLEGGGIAPIELLGPAAPEAPDVPVVVDTAAEAWREPGPSSDDGGACAVLALGVSYEGNMLVCGNARGEVSVWDVATGALFRTLCQLGGVYIPVLRVLVLLVTDEWSRVVECAAGWLTSPQRP